jgi:hypothetical protein
MTTPYDSYEDGTLFPGYGDPDEDIDPDMLLEQVRRRVSEYLEDGEGLSDAGVEDLVRSFDLLDGQLSTGSPMPEAWARPGADGRRIEDVRLPRRRDPPLLSGYT